MGAYAAGIPEKVRFIYWAIHDAFACFSVVCGIEPNVEYQACYVNPSDGTRHDIGHVKPDSEGRWRPPTRPSIRDWLLLLEVVEDADAVGTTEGDTG